MNTNPTRHEVEVDRQLAEIWTRENAAYAKLASAKLSIAYKLGIRPHYVTKTRREVSETIDQLLEMAAAKLANASATGWDADETQRAVDRWHAIKAEIAAARAEAQPLEAEFNAKPWSRFFLVTNANGHIHSSMSCSTCNPRTQFGWLPELSGLTEKDAVDAHGPRLCTVCYPTAPVEWTAGTQADDSCPGSGTYDHENFRRTSYTGSGRATCTHCHQPVGITTSGKIRKHAKETT